MKGGNRIMLFKVYLCALRIKILQPLMNSEYFVYILIKLERHIFSLETFFYYNFFLLFLKK